MDGFNKYSYRALVLEEQPENLDVMLSLATVYEEQGEEQRALELVDYGKAWIFLSDNSFLTYDYSSDEEES